MSWLNNLLNRSSVNAAAATPNAPEAPVATPTVASVPLESIVRVGNASTSQVDLLFQANTVKVDKQDLVGKTLADVVSRQVASMGGNVQVVSYTVVIDGQSQNVPNPSEFVLTEEVLNGVAGRPGLQRIHANPSSATLG